MTPEAHVLPLDVTISVAETETLMAAATRAGYYWPTVCHGDGDCGSCAVVVERGAEHLPPPGPVERNTLARGLQAREPRARLACQLRPSGPIQVRKRGVRLIEPLTVIPIERTAKVGGP